MKGLILLLSVAYLLNSLNALRKRLWSKEDLHNYMDSGKLNIQMTQTALGYRVPFLLLLSLVSISIIYLSLTINILAPSKIIVLPIFFILLNIYDFISISKYLKGEKEFKESIFDFPIMIIKSAYIIFFLTIYLNK